MSPLNGHARTPIVAQLHLPVHAPYGWKWVRLTDVAKLESGHTPSRSEPSYWNGEVQWLSLKDIKGLDGKYVVETQDHPTELGISNSSARMLPKGTVALCRTASVGKSVILGCDMATSQDFVNWVCGSALLPEYLYYAFCNSELEFDRLQQGTTHKTIYMPIAEQFALLLPPLPEQHRIAAILDKADAIRRKRVEGIRLTEELLRSAYLDMFGDPVKNQEGWDTAAIGTLCRLVRGSSPRPKGDPRYYNGPVKRLMVEDLTRDGLEVFAKIDSLTEEGAKLSRPVPMGTIVLVVSGNVGLPAKLMVDACIHDGFVGLLDLDTSKVRPDYLLHTLLLIRVIHDRNKAGAIWQNLTTDQVKATIVPLPSLNDQDRFLAVVEQHRNLATTRKQQFDQTDRLFCSLVQRAFRGGL